METVSTTNSTPPILEVEDTFLCTNSHPIDSPSPIQAEINTALNNKRSTLQGNNDGEENGEDAKETELPKVAPILGPANPFLGIDDHLPFWTTYDRVAGAYDRELLDGWNKSLDVLLIFAGLFSAINTAFIIESYRGLQADPVETTNALLRLLISHRNDNLTLSFAELNPGGPSSPLAFPVNSLFFASLSFSLTAAFGAVTAKQWLNEYTNVGATKALHIQGKLRQRRFKGLKTWHLRLIIELLPMLLQASLLLFLVGVVYFLWTIDRRVATLQLVLSATGVAIYLITIFIGIIFPASPFQTPLSKYLPSYFSKIKRRMGRILEVFKPSNDEAGHPPWITALKKAAEGVTKTPAFQSVRSSTANLWTTIRRRFSTSKLNQDADLESLEDRKRWKPGDITAAESVVWLLEQAEHPDVTIIASDAVLRIPPDILLHLIQKREDLFQRLETYHASMLPPFSQTSSGEYDIHAWLRSWPDRAIISGMALQHIRRARKYSPADVDPGVFAPKITIEINTIGAGNDDPAHIVKVMLQFMGMSTTGRLSGSLSAYGLKSVLTNLAVNSGGLLPLDIELFDPRNASIGTSLVTSVSPLRLVMEDITHFCGAFPLNDGVTFCDWTSQFFSYLRQQLSEFQGQISRDALSHIALMLAAVCRCLKRMPGVSDAEEERLRDLILTRSYEVDKGSALMRNTMLAFCMIPVREDIDRLGLDVFRMLLHATGNLITSSFHPPHHLIKDTNFRQAVLRIAKAYPGDRKLQIHVADILERCADGDWVLPLHSDFQDVMTHLIECSFGPEKRPWHSQAPSGIFAMIARVADADQFLRSVKLLCSRGFHKKLARKQAKTYLNLASEFINRILGLNSNDDQSYSELLEAQIWLVVAILSNDNWEWNPYYDWTLAFFNRVLEADEDLHWPSYFISAGISPSSDNDSKSTRSQPLKVMNAQRLMPFWTFSVEEANEAIRNTWCGEAILLLWKKANLEVARGRLHSDWDKSIFFDIGVASTVVKYFESVMDQGYNGVDWEFLRKYLETVQMETGYTREKWQTGIRARNVDSANLYSQEIVLLWGDIVDALSTLNDLVSKGEAEK